MIASLNIKYNQFFVVKMTCWLEAKTNINQIWIFHHVRSCGKRHWQICIACIPVMFDPLIAKQCNSRKDTTNIMCKSSLCYHLKIEKLKCNFNWRSTFLHLKIRNHSFASRDLCYVFLCVMHHAHQWFYIITTLPSSYLWSWKLRGFINCAL